MDKEKYFCAISGNEIPEARVEALKMLGTPQTQWTCVEHSTTKPKKGIFMGEHGTSEMKMVDKVYDDSVRAVFKSSDKADSEDVDIPETVSRPPEGKPGFYSEKEINYYTDNNEDPTEENISVIKKLDN
jgi:hypothetical protein